MSKPTRIFGHRNPDADAICSAIAYADFKRRTDDGTFVPARCGNSNVRIDAVLDRFGLPLPDFIGDVTPRLRDVMARELVTVHPEATCAEVLELIERHDFQVVPVLNDAGSLEGVVSIFQLGRYFIPGAARAREMRRVRTSIGSIVRALDAEVLHQRDGDEVEDLFVRVGAMDPGSFGRFAEEEPENIPATVIVVGDRRNIQEKSIDLGVRLLVVTGGLSVPAEVVAQAGERGVSVIISPYDSATTAWAIRAAARVREMMGSDYVEFGPEETVLDVRRRTATLDPAVFMVTTDGGKLAGVFTRRDILRPSSARIILVDHNELSQAVPGADQVDIVEVVDHHRLGNLRTQDPILFINRPVGSTCTIIADLYRQAGIVPEPEIAGALMGGLVSDTLNLRSPTTTRADGEVLTWLEDLAGETGDGLAELIFSSGSVVATRDPDDVIALDRKIYEEGSFRFAVSQVEEVGFTEFWDRCEALSASLERSRAEIGLDFAGLLVTDIKSEDSLLVVSGSPALVEAITYPAIYPGEIYSLPGIMSRKKQLIPFLTGILGRLRP
jgi:manganese-dependent inorganic pyrophosphatase